MKSNKFFIYSIFSVLSIVVLNSCNLKPPIENAVQKRQIPSIFPEYTNVTIPPNIAPLNFQIEENGVQFFVRLKGESGNDYFLKSKSPSIRFNIRKWKTLLKENIGKRIMVEVFVKNIENKWLKYSAFSWDVANEEIDNYLTYRLINVGYVLWKKMGLYQRDLTTFKESSIMLNRNSDGNCMNCHSFCKNNPDRFLFHMRGKFAGTVISTPDSTFKIDSKATNTIAAGAYPAWHPEGKHIAFSVDIVRQFFHGVDKRNEVYDYASDIIVYNINKNTIVTNPAVSTPNREALPNWSPDGKYLYFCRAPKFNDTIEYNEVKYDLMRIQFNFETDTWGKLDTLLKSSDLESTISFPKASPDGKYILFTRASHGYFTIFNSTSDLYFLDLTTGEIFPYPFNSSDVDSFHSWSSNSRWVVFSSKRINGLTTRPFITYIDSNGKARKPFVMPQRDPLFYRSFMNNYNVPELITGPIKLNNQKFLDIVRGKASSVLFDEKSSYNVEEPDSSGNTLQ